MTETTDFRVCLVTFPDRETAKMTAVKLVAEKLCACASLMPGVESIYAWQGKTEISSETLLMIKTQQNCIQAIDAKIRELHPYEVYEFISLPVIYGNADYLNWISESTT